MAISYCHVARNHWQYCTKARSHKRKHCFMLKVDYFEPFSYTPPPKKIWLLLSWSCHIKRVILRIKNKASSKSTYDSGVDPNTSIWVDDRFICETFDILFANKLFLWLQEEPRLSNFATILTFLKLASMHHSKLVNPVQQCIHQVFPIKNGASVRVLVCCIQYVLQRLLSGTMVGGS